MPRYRVGSPRAEALQGVGNRGYLLGLDGWDQWHKGRQGELRWDSGV
jgi:hypothetical protein